MKTDIFIINWWDKNLEGIDMPAQEDLLNYLSSTDFEIGDYSFTDYGLPVSNVPAGYAFAIQLAAKPEDPPEKKRLVVFKTLPVNATIDQIKTVISRITSGEFRYVENAPKNGEGGEYQDPNLIEVPWSGSSEQASSGILPFDILPDWLKNLFGGLFKGLHVPWWAYAALAAYATTKVIQKDSNKILWGATAAWATWAALRVRSKDKEIVKKV
jgi:hypothetical protein